MGRAVVVISAFENKAEALGHGSDLSRLAKEKGLPDGYGRTGTCLASVGVG